MGVYSICKGLRTVLCDYGYCTSAFGERKVFLSPLLISIESLLTIKGCKKRRKKGKLYDTHIAAALLTIVVKKPISSRSLASLALDKKKVPY